MKKMILLSVLATLCLFLRAWGQAPNTASYNLTGNIRDESGSPLTGATIKSETTVSRSDAGGNFTIALMASSGKLLISFAGYESQTVPYQRNHARPLVITLKPAVFSVDEVQVIAYGKTTRKLNTGNISSVTGADLERQPVTNVLAALQGRVPGLVISQQSGVPGSSFNIQVRGQSALDLTYTRNDPLFIIDGVPFESGNLPANQINAATNNPTSISSGGISPLNTVSPQDIERIDVLKDADATAIYGSRGANGVILITTKKGKIGETKLNLSASTGISRIGRSAQLLNTQQYLDMRREGFANDKVALSTVPGNAGFAPDVTLWDNNQYTDFKKLLIGSSAKTTNVQASLTGGNESIQFLLSGKYHHETTVYPGNFADNILSFNYNLSHTTKDKRFTLNFSGMYSSDQNRLPRYDLTRYINLPPNLKLTNDTGGLAWASNGVIYNTLDASFINPLSLLEDRYRSTNSNLLSNLQLSYKLLPGLAARVNLGYNTFRTDEQSARLFAAIDPYSSELPSSGFAASLNQSWIAEPQLEYNLTGKAGKINVLMGSTFQSKTSRMDAQYGTNYNSDLLLGSIAAAPTVTASNNYSQYRYTAFFGRLNYNLNNKYILNLSARRDGSSRFGLDNRFATFGALGAAWLIQSEKLIRENLPFLSFGKLRASYGRTGNDQIGDYRFLNLWTNTTNPYGGLSGLYPRTLYNPDYQWEVNHKLEAALELGFWQDHLLLSASFYRNRSDNQLISYALPGQTGFTSVVQNLPALVENRGWEFVLTTKNLHTARLDWTTAFNITLPQNKLLRFPGIASTSYNSRYVVGQSLNLIYGYRCTGVDPQTGIYIFEDVNKDGQLTIADYQVLGKTDPKFYGGMQNRVSYGAFDLNFFFEFRKQKGLNYLRQLASTPAGSLINQPVKVLDRWRQPGDQSAVQQFTSGFTPAYNASAYLGFSDGIYSDASYIRMKNLSLSYTIPAAWLDRYHVHNCRVYLEAQNLFTITGYRGSDPETQNQFILPPLRTLMGGIQFNF
jgi:TonB-linked SusC/RagA family outer membrane protein